MESLPPDHPPWAQLPWAFPHHSHGDGSTASTIQKKKQPGYIYWETPAASEDLPLVPSTSDGMGESEPLLHGHIHAVMGAQCELSLSDIRSLSHTEKNPAKKILPKAFCMSLHCRGSPKVLQSSSGLHSACTRRSSRAGLAAPGGHQGGDKSTDKSSTMLSHGQCLSRGKELMSPFSTHEGSARGQGSCHHIPRF